MSNAPAKVLFFTGVPKGTRAALDAIARHQSFAPGERIFRQGESATALIVVVSGLVKVWRAAEEGTAITLALLGPGEPIGTLHVARDMPNTANVSAHLRTEAIVWPLDPLRRIMAGDAALAASITNIVSRHAVRMIERVEEMATAPVEVRVARALCRVSGIAAREDGLIDLPLSRQDVADMSATTLPSVSRIMARWREDGLIGGHRGHIHLLDRARLCAIAGFSSEEVLEIRRTAP